MIQVGQIQLLGSRSTSLPIVLSVQSQVELDPMQIEAITEPQVCHGDSVQQITTPMDGVRAEPPASEDVDVQIIFCAPRRKKKRRRRLESAHLASPLSQTCRPPVGLPSPQIHHVLPQQPRRRSVGVVQRLELCHIGEEESPSIRAGSLPSIPCATSNVPTIQYPWFAQPNYYEAPSSQFPSLADSAAWFEQSLPTLQPRPLPSIPWRPMNLDDPNPKKRKHDEDLDEPAVRPSSSRQSVQVSPRTTPESGNPTFFSPYRINSSQYEMYDPDQYFPASPTWPSNSWNTFDDIGQDSYVPSFSQHPSLSMDLARSDAATTANPPSRDSLISNGLGSTGGGESWHQNAGQTKAGLPPNPVRISTIQPPHLPVAGEKLLRRVQSPAPHSNPHGSPPPSGTIALNNINIPHASPPVTPFRPGVRATSLHASAAPVPPCNNIRVAQSSDMLRKPSLYSIPPWPSPLGSSMPPTPNTTIHAHTTSPISIASGSSGRISETTQARVNHVGSPHVPNAFVAQRSDSETRQEATCITSSNAATTASRTSHERVGSNVTTFQIPKARLGRKHSPNMIVDVAETCQELFPFAEVAERHEAPIQKVFDTFSAIIQLPLLRNADDRRRHGSLGKRRMKEYRDAKKAMEKAQEAKRKAQMKEMRARVEDAARGKEGRNQPLLKSAVLNNAREAQGSN
ncbi:hypothetical protein DL98DRAFT_587002 [Cadophora sp. DSE1049]|nr:hypothetical protein DL98DRAFT_587002 [Cadophora sp. DSE1049]